MLLKSCLLVLVLGAVAQGAPRVIGGHDAPDHKYPYQVSMRLRKNGQHQCSASILNERWILTAGHCVDDWAGIKVDTYTISAGTNYLNENGTVYYPEQVIIHEKFRDFYFYDIAMIRLNKDIVFTESVKPIKLPTEDLKDYSRKADFAGWGSTEVWGEAPNALQEITLNVVTNEVCKKIKDRITDSHICTLNKKDEGICHGDSGGPLVVDGVQVGIASYVTPCAVNHPDVYTRVFSYIDWIRKNMEKYDSV